MTFTPPARVVVVVGATISTVVVDVDVTVIIGASTRQRHRDDIWE